eukprot:gene9183-10883_t
MALVQFRSQLDDKPPLGGLMFIGLGTAYLYGGSLAYLVGAWHLRHTLALTPGSFVTLLTHAVIPPVTISTGVLCLIDEHPKWILDLCESQRKNLPKNLGDFDKLK